MLYVAVCHRSTPGMGRSDQNRTYVNLVVGIRELDVPYATLAEYLAAQNPEFIWNNPGSNEYVIELTLQEYLDIVEGRDPLNHGVSTQPRWQQRTDTSATQKDFGSFSDPQAKASTFSSGVELKDTRLIWEIYNGDPDAGGTHLEREEFEEGQDGGQVVRHILQYNPDGSRSNTNKQDQNTYIAGKRFRFDFVNGKTTINVSTNMATVTGDGLLAIAEDRDFWIRIPGGAKGHYVAEVFRRVVYPE